jgi:RNA polymerase sigma-70 factor (ECF subfamily)
MPGTSHDVPRGLDMDGPAAVRSDEQLMIDFSHGSAAAFEELFLRYKQPLFGFFRRRVADTGRAEELTQDAFVAVVRASGRYVPSATFRTWLYAIGYTILRADRRKAAFRGMFHREDVEVRDLGRDNTIDIDLFMRDALRRLDREEREILLLREFEQLSYAEIAEVLRLPVNTVRSRLFRARMALRELLAAPSDTSSSKGFAQPGCDFAKPEFEEGL